ncbi:toxin Fic [Bacteroidia bacterium]|nr:toxin Fic [Bacteroidia bacterium]
MLADGGSFGEIEFATQSIIGYFFIFKNVFVGHLNLDIDFAKLLKIRKFAKSIILIMNNDELFNQQSQILIYQSADGSIKIDVRLEDETVWLTQAQMGQLFGKDRRTIGEHIRNTFKEGELQEEVVCRNFRHTTQHGAIAYKMQEVTTRYYNLDVIISVGYRVKSPQGTQFRIWATQRLKEYIIKGFTLNDDRFKKGSSMNYFNELQERIREIRLSERFFYQKIKDIYTTSIDYDPKNQQTVLFFKIIQNKLLWAISQQTAAELVYRRVNANLPLMGMQSFDKKNTVAIKKSDVSIAKNYLTEDEMRLLGLIVEQYLAFAETMAQQHMPMYMKDWIERLDLILQLNGRELLNHAGTISHELAMQKSGEEFEKYEQVRRTLEYKQSLDELEEDIKRLKQNK